MADVDFCVVGAGFAGLAAALRLKQAGLSVALLEARDRVGGRTFTELRADGTWIDRGGAWVGPARSPVDFVEQNWTTERYSGGGMISHAPPGVLTEFGPALREPCGRIHWAGTESSAVMCGWVDGAVRSGERAAAEAMAGERVAAA
ncbi:MAG: FAD-dependent oxidoreductase [Mycobacterium sp.]